MSVPNVSSADRFPQDAQLTSGGVPTWPPVVVRPDQMSDEHSAGYQSMLGHSYPPAMASPYPSDVKTMPQDGGAWTQDARPLLKAYPGFNNLPEELQELILASPTATGQMLDFLQAGGQIEFESGLGNYQGY